MFARRIAWCCLLSCIALMARAKDVTDAFDLPPGFTVSQFASNDLAHDIFSMTLNARGQVVVSGPGYIRTLVDDNGDGEADRVVPFANAPRSGAQGLCFDGATLYFTGDGGLWRLKDENSDGVADGPAEILVRLRGGEHGAHAILIGPDGHLWVLCGNDAGVLRAHIRDADSPIGEPRCGTVLRLARDGSGGQVLAHGFRNPYDMAFTSSGRLYTVDSDGERDHHLPWYAPTRMFDIGVGLEHGWLAGGWTNSWSRPEWFFDNVERVAEFGRGSPTGVCAYRHRQFPRKYRDGIFAADWTFGRVYFVDVQNVGNAPRAAQEIFLQSRGEDGFAPVDLALTPAGDLMVAIGGRKTRGGVFRISYRGPEGAAASSDSLLAVLDQADPLASWARAKWEPAADRLGAEAFRAAVRNAELTSERRVRAVEILVDRFAGVDAKLLDEIAPSDRDVKARVIWALADSDDPDAMRRLGQLTSENDPLLVRAAWESLIRGARGAEAAPDFASGLSNRDRRIRSLAMAYAADKGSASFANARAALVSSDDPRAQLAVAIVDSLRGEPRVDEGISVVIHSLGAKDAGLKIDAIRLAQRWLGDVQIERSSPEEPVGYAPRKPAGIASEARTKLTESLVAMFPSGDETIDCESARLLAMLACDDPSLPAKLATFWKDESPPTDDLHYLCALARLPAARTTEVTQATAEALVGLHRKLRARNEFTSRTWPDRVGDVVVALCQRDPGLGAAIVESPGFGLSEHALLAQRLDEALQRNAARKLIEALSRSQDEESAGWSSELIQLVERLPDEEALPALRGQWDDPAVREPIAKALAARARQEDWARLVEGLSAIDDAVVVACAKALAKLKAEEAEAGVASAARALARFCDVREARGKTAELPYKDARHSLAKLLGIWRGSEFAIDETSAVDPRESYVPVFAWVKEAYPSAAQLLSTSAGSEELLARLDQANLDSGDAARGRAVFEKQACHRCHGEAGRAGNDRLGPDLTGVSERFNRHDLLAAIVDPSANVSPTFRTTQMVTRSGKIYHGLVVYESPDGTLLQTGPDTTVRITGDEFLAMQPSERSLMPDGLLTGLADEQIADLLAYLRTLKQ